MNSNQKGSSGTRVRALRAILLTAMAAIAVTVQAQPVSVTVDQEPVMFRGQGPQVDEGRVLVPLRGVFEKMGANVDYAPQERTIRVTRDQTDIQLRDGSSTAYVNRKEITLDTPTTIVRGSVLVPLRFVSEHLGAANVAWDPQTRTVAIDTRRTPDESAAMSNVDAGSAPPQAESGAAAENPPGPPSMATAPAETSVPPAETSLSPAETAPPSTTPAAVDAAAENPSAFEWGRWLPWILGALVVLGLIGYLLTRGPAGQVIAAGSKGGATGTPADGDSDGAQRRND